jgi:nicotinamidase/pyrazinamidase
VNSEKWIAEDVCMLARVRDACHEGFDVVLIEKATRPVTSERGEKAKRQMRNAGASIVE